MNAVYTTIIIACWASILIVWTVGFFGNKRTTSIPRSLKQFAINGFLVIGFILLVKGFVTPHTGSDDAITPSSLFSFIGTAMTITGTIFAIWARLALGRNWSGAVITLKERHELVTTGPYRLVRHPIYSGLLLVALGAVLVDASIEGIIGLAGITIALILRIPEEESLMTHAFPSVYSAYRARTKKLLPFVW